MSAILLFLTETTKQNHGRPGGCPHCGSPILQRWGKVPKPVKEKAETTANIFRYRCKTCCRTFRDYPKGIDRSDYTPGIRKLAALLWTFGLSYRNVIKIFGRIGIPLSRSTVWREGQELASQLNQKKLPSQTQRFTLDQNYIHRISSKFGVVVAIDLGDGKRTIIGTLNEHNPAIVTSWLQPIIKDVNLDMVQLGSNKLDRFSASTR